MATCEGVISFLSLLRQIKRLVDPYLLHKAWHVGNEDHYDIPEYLLVAIARAGEKCETGGSHDFQLRKSILKALGLPEEKPRY